MRTFLFTLILLCGVSGARAQVVNLSDSLSRVLSYRPALSAKFDTRNSFVTGRAARIQGIKVGVSFKKILSLGVGYNWLATEFSSEDAQGNSGIIRLRYIAPYAEYSFYRKGPWEATIPLQVGFGKSFIQFENENGLIRSSEESVILYEPAMTIEYKVMNLVGFGGGIGYRLMLKNNRSIDQQFTSPVYLLRVRLIFDEWMKFLQR